VVTYWVKSVRRLFEDENGPTTVEYAVLLALIVAVCVGSVQALSSATGESFNASSNAISTAIGS